MTKIIISLSLLAIIMVLLVIWIVKPSIKKTEITKIDKEGNEFVEIHETRERTAIGCAVKIIVSFFIIVFLLMVFSAVIRVGA